MTKQPFWFRDICRHTLYIYLCVVHAYTDAIICIDDTCMYISVYIYIYIHGSVWMSSWHRTGDFGPGEWANRPPGWKGPARPGVMALWPEMWTDRLQHPTKTMKRWTSMVVFGNDLLLWVLYSFTVDFSIKKYVYWRVATETLDISMFFFFFPQNMGIMGYLIIKAYPGHVYTYIIIYLVSLMNVGDCYCRL